jgi:hypothetical protein
MFIPQLAQHGLSIALIIVVSVMLSIAASALTLKWLAKDRP